jgi:hypothetical protein
MMKITITSPVDHDGKRLQVGKTIELADDVAEALVKAGAAEAVAGRKAKTEAAPVADDTPPEA